MKPTKSKQKAPRFDRRQSLGYLVNNLARLFARALEQRLSRHGVALGQFPLLLVLWEEGTSRNRNRAPAQLEQPTIANTLQRMERDGLVSTAPDPVNRRRVLIRLTDRARAMEAPLTSEAAAVNALATSDLSPTEVERFIERIQRLEERLKADAG